MSCLALSLQLANGSDILLQTCEWFPPARALVALFAFRQTRLAFAASKHNNNPSTSSSSDADTIAASLGDDPLAASSGQVIVIVDVESHYRVVYRLGWLIVSLGIGGARGYAVASRGGDPINVYWSRGIRRRLRWSSVWK
ncbi:hypothetical protein I3843_01G278800 [Carya illinoinensis]|nr:hypothetical protein I3843_01G278800 [Carya illinoinensis]